MVTNGVRTPLNWHQGLPLTLEIPARPAAPNALEPAAAAPFADTWGCGGHSCVVERPGIPASPWGGAR